MTNNNELKKMNIPGEAKLMLDAFSKIESGTLEITTPEYLVLSFAGKNNGPNVKLHIRDWNALAEVFNKSDIGLAESFISNKIEISSISNLIEFAILNENALIRAFKGNIAKILFYRLKHEARENTLFGSKENIKEHYDLGNNFYSLWLDSTMTYSSALFEHSHQKLEDAQNNKYQSMLNLISPKLNDHILEVGCGWGGFMEYAGKKGYHVTGITISEEQFRFTENRIKENGLSHLCNVRLCDYRDLVGEFDCAVSIEMIEAVGEKYWNSYFELFKKVVRPNGKFAIQAITMNDNNFDSYRKGTDFIQQYVFPGGMLISPNALKYLVSQHGYSYIEDKFFGLDYAATLAFWSERFNKNVDQVKAIGFDDKFIRLWNFYLGYCEGAFKSKRIDLIQFSAKV